MPRAAGPSRRPLDGCRQLVQREVLRSADLQRLPSRGRVRNGPLDKGGDVNGRDKVDRTAAATDPEMAALHQEAEAARLERMEHNARHLHERGYLRQGVSLEHARDVLWSYSSPELYELLVLRRGWPPDRYGRFVADGMIAALLPHADVD